jgi:hypothetical protein
MEAEIYGKTSAEQEEQVLGDDEVANPDQSTEPTEESTDDPFETVIADEDTQPDDGLPKVCLDCTEKDHRFNRYKGKTDRTIFDLRAEVTKLNKGIARLKQANTEIQAKLDERETLLDEDQRDILGEDAAKIIEGLQRELREIKRSTEVSQASEFEEKAEDYQKTNATEFMDNLRGLVPDLDEMNKDADFNEWLRQEDDYGIERLATLRSDQHRGDYVRVAQFFKEYKALKATLDTVKKDTKFSDSADAYAGPTGSRGDSSTKQVKESKDGWIKQSEINQYEKDVMAGKYKYDSSFPEAMEARIFKASVDGKIHQDVPPLRQFKVR